MILFRYSFISIGVFLLTACGGGATTKESLPLKRLYFIDSPVNGVDYECGVRKFTTRTHIVNGVKREGVALCRHEPVTFKLGSLLLGTIEHIQHEQKIYPQDLVGVSRDNFQDENLLKVALLLQSLDDDGELLPTITIGSDIKKKIDIESFQNHSLKELETLILKWGKEPIPIEYVKEHLIQNSKIPHLEKFIQIEIKDDVEISEVIGLIEIENGENLLKIEIVEGMEKEKFKIERDGRIKIAKRLNAKERFLYNFQIQATNKEGKSNIATLSIHLSSIDEVNVEFIEKPTILTKEIYTNTNNYNINLEGREGADIYIDGKKTLKKIPKEKHLIFNREILGADTIKESALILGYPNGIRSEPALFEVIKDTVAPTIQTSSALFFNENYEIVNKIDVYDSNRDRGLSYYLSGEDHQYFEISTIGELSLNRTLDFELPKDANKDNIYEITLHVTDRAGNSSSKAMSISIGDIPDDKPMVLPFYTKLSLPLPIGSFIGQILFYQGDSPITSLELKGEDSNYFKVSKLGAIQTLKEINSTKKFKLTIEATNRFGTTQQDALIEVEEKSSLF